jgi:hypothetical protein
MWQHSYSSYLEVVCPIRNPRTRHAVVTGTDVTASLEHEMQFFNSNRENCITRSVGCGLAAHPFQFPFNESTDTDIANCQTGHKLEISHKQYAWTIMLSITGLQVFFKPELQVPAPPGAELSDNLITSLPQPS